jgi:hypothetical protein
MFGVEFGRISVISIPPNDIRLLMNRAGTLLNQSGACQRLVVAAETLGKTRAKALPLMLRLNQTGC